MSYPIYYVEADDTLPIFFDSFDGGTGASITMTGLAVTDIEIYKDGAATTRASDNGYTLLDTDGIDFDSKTGIHGFSLDLSDNSDAGFYAVGSWYQVIVSSITIDGQTVNFVAAAFRIVSATRGMAGTALPDAAAAAVGGVYTRGSGAGQINQDANGRVDVNVAAISGDSVAADNLESQYDTTGLEGDTFPATQLQIGQIEVTGAAVHQIASSYVLTTGTQSSGTVSSTTALDGTNHEHTDVGNAMELYYQFLIGAGIPESVELHGYLNSNDDDLDVFGYDWVAAGWVQIGNLSGKNQSTNDIHNFTLFINMVGSGVNEGIVRVRFQKASGLSTATLAIDQIFVAFALGGSEGYEGGAIWIDTTLSNTGTQVGIDGTARNPVSTIAAANTLSASTNLNRFNIAPGSSITFAASQDDQIFEGKDWTLALGGQSISGSHFFGASVSGVGTGASAPTFEHCIINTCTLPPTHFDRCGFATTLTFGAAGSYIFENCFSEVAGTGAPIFDLGSAIGNEDFHFRDYSGGIDLRNMGQTGTDAGSIEGRGNVILNVNCTGGNLVIRGAFTKEDNSATVTITDDARIDVPQIKTVVHDEPLSGHQTQGTSGAAITMAAYAGPRGPGVYIDDAAANTGTTLGDDGTLENPVSTIAAATTIAEALGVKRFYLTNDTAITLAQTYEDYEFIGIGMNNQVTLGSQDVDNSVFINVTLTGTQGGTQFMQTELCRLQAILSAEIIADRCWITGDITMRAATNQTFGHCQSGIPGGGTPDLTFPGSGTTTVNFRHYSGGLTVKSATVNDTMSYDCPAGQFIIDSTCTSLTVHVRGNCTITDNGTTTVLTQDAAINRTAINAEVDTAWTTQVADSVAADGDRPTREQAIYLAIQFLTEFLISGTTYTVRKPDGSTTLATFTLTDATNPTGATRS